MDIKREAKNELQQFNELAASGAECDKRIAALIVRVLLKLTPEERAILDQFYINRSTNHAKRLSSLLKVEQAHIYRLKNKALEKYCIYMYGIIDFYKGV